MLQVEITTTEPTSNKEYTNTLPQITHLTPERVHRWNQALFPAVSSLQSGTCACALILGESPERHVLLQRDARLKSFKIGLVKRELIVDVCQTLLLFFHSIQQFKQCYRLFGNKRPDFSDTNEHIVGRNAFYKDFLLKNKGLLEGFLSDSYLDPL